MSELTGEDLETEGIPRYGFGSEGSLRDRMARRAEEMQKARTQRFPVPGYSDMLEVELRPLSWETQRKISDRHARHSDAGTRDVYVASDVLLTATVGFWEVDDSGSRQAVETSWTNLARGLSTHFPESGTPRQAVIAVIAGPQGQHTGRVIDLWNDWGFWNNAERTTIGEELGEDFAGTR